MGGGLGWQNGLPLELGGGTSRTEDIYNALRGALGSAPGPKDGIEDLWRQAKAASIGGVVIATERAALQAFPHVATDALPRYESILGLVATGTETERRAAAAAAWVVDQLADQPSVTASLDVIDAAFYLGNTPDGQTTSVQVGRQFGDRPNLGGWAQLASGRQSSAWGNFSDDFVLRAYYALSGGLLSIPSAKQSAAERYLNTVLPAWVDYTIATADGFYLDGGADGTSLLDQTAFGS